MIWPAILLTMLRFRIKRHYIAIITASIALLSWILRIYLSVNSASAARIYNGLDTRADSLMIGCTIGIAIYSGLISKNAKRTVEKLLIRLCPISILCLLVLSIVARWDSPWMYYSGLTIVAILSSILVLDILINEQSVMRKFLLNRRLVWIGTISYSLYLWHYPIYRTMRAMKYDGFTTFIVGTILTFMLSIFSYYVIEKPILNFKPYFSQVRGKTKKIPREI
jgi:peptidoglycan/LPS O-acetylase OafA/YrhL